MLTSTGCRARREQLLATVEADLLVISNPRHIFYLSGHAATPLNLGGWGPNHLLIQRDGKTTLFAHNFYMGNADHINVDSIETWHWYDAKKDPARPVFQQGVEELNKRLRGAGRIGIELGQFPYGVEVQETTDITDAIMTMRRSKHADELACIRRAIAAITEGHQAARTIIQPGLTEIDVYNAIYAAIVKAAGEAVIPLGDYAVGERAFQGGGPATERTLRAGDLMILDVFPIIGGYRGDFTATVSVDSRITDRQQQLQDALHAGIAAGEALLKPGTVARDVYRAVHTALDERGYGEAFPHHAGHGLGLGHPEAPYLVPNSTEVLQAGDVITLEPGAYGADFGARIEHNYRITETGFERLTDHQTTFV